MLNFGPYEQPEFDTELGAQTSDAVRRAQRSVIEATVGAVIKWATECGMTAEQWLEFYEPDVRIGAVELGKLSVTVTAKLRPMPLEFTVDA